ncbi:tRNA threonylcarbamoyladenosine biosynthesis protein TsaB [Balnearium lithotrophicum]|uniref:tRNA threonylcarbamoyladenosine biosynthesis protein TsaB n=1 Tax=Balnearium lithotrophicum TaxID=223788 RepID=A0A521CEF4_9BACT|nr:tRNA (adenosine(37)-N6)-threonylcarbamoyltransferase complex dimerization subunit type 1 TsaB [Balnearium lithotrophicum]SMO57816.1 tRNA threonylcarbamoyladenosine biosynthesis protein TsaB [Balnearium lithotrophicum]
MIRLGIDLSLPEGSIAVSQGNEILSSVSWNRPKIHAEVVFKQIDNLLNLIGISKDEVEEVVVSSGPGSFTGVRLSVSVGKAFKECGKRVFSGTTLRALSSGYEKLGFTPVPLIPARRGKYYTEIKGVSLDIDLAEIQEKLREIEKPLIVFKGEIPKELSLFPNVEERTPLAVKLLRLEREFLSPLKFHYVREHDAKPQT